MGRGWKRELWPCSHSSCSSCLCLRKQGLYFLPCSGLHWNLREMPPLDSILFWSHYKTTDSNYNGCGTHPLTTSLEWQYTYQRKFIFWTSKICSLFQSSLNLLVIPTWTFLLQVIFNYCHVRLSPSQFVSLFLLSLLCSFRFRVRLIVGVSCDSSIDFTGAVSSCEFECFLLSEWLEVETKCAKHLWLCTFIVRKGWA